MLLMNQQNRCTQAGGEAAVKNRLLESGILSESVRTKRIVPVYKGFFNNSAVERDVMKFHMNA